MLKRATWCRTDIWFGRYVGHPLTAMASLSATAGLVALLAVTPAVGIGWWWWLFILGPGVWLFVMGMLFNLAAVGKLFGMPSSSGIFTGTDTSWKSLLFRREALASLLLLSLAPATVNWYAERPFDNQDFQRCVKWLTLDGQEKLVKSVSVGATRNEFRAACHKALPPPVEVEARRPETFEEMQRRVNANKE